MREDAGTVFVVDDDASVRRGLDRLLRVAGHRVQAFASAREFLEQAGPRGPACLLLDVRMPGQTGLELLDGLTAAGWDIPVIFITGHADVPRAVHALTDGLVDWLTKPFDEQLLLDTVEQALARDRRGHAEGRHEAPVSGPARHVSPWRSPDGVR